ncbi:MAG TPA: hypothetical protein VEY70_08420 [Metabacillus sp.]|nr:hypothetical protein [Metabacillus sp.]
MNKKEIEELLAFTKHERKIFMPNEIFEDLVSCEIKNSSHIAFAYSFYYLASWLYRYTKYMDYEKYNVKKLKQILGYSKSNKTLDYIIKDGGLLDSIDYTRSSTNPPMLNYFGDGYVKFTHYSELKDDFKYIPIETNIRHSKIKEPLKGLHREECAKEEKILNGTFYEIENTHLISIEIFIECMSNKDIGCIGFYLYCFLKYKTDKFPMGVDISLEQITRQTGIKKTSRDKYLDMLKKYNFISCIPTDFIVGMPKEYRRSSRYLVNDISRFKSSKSDVKKRNVKDWKSVEGDYINSNNEKGKSDLLNGEDLPFI